MTSQPDLETLYVEASQALKARDYDRASGLLKQILVVDENYKDVSRLLAQAVSLKRRKWFNDLRLWGVLGLVIMVSLGFFVAPRFGKLYPVQPTVPVMVNNPTATLSPTAAAASTETNLPIPTSIPLTWRRLSIGQEFERDTVTAIVVDPIDADIVYTGMANAGVYKSIDGTRSWRPILEGLEITNIKSLLIDTFNPNTLYAVTTGGIFKTVNGGEAWYKIHDGSQLLMDPQNSSNLYVEDWNIYATNDGGTTWNLNHDTKEACPQNIDHWAIHPQNGQILLAARNWQDGGCQSGVYRSVDSGKNWELIGLEGRNDTFSVAIGLNEQGDEIIYTQSFESRDLGKTWTHRERGCGLLPVNPSTPTMVHCSGGYKTDEVVSGKIVHSYWNENWAFGVTSIYTDQYQGKRRIIAGEQGIYISMDNGATWQEQSNGLGAARLELKPDPEIQSRLYLSSHYHRDNRFCSTFRSTDLGTSWKKIAASRNSMSCRPNFDSQGNLYLRGDRDINKTDPTLPRGNYLHKSTNGGDSWTSLQIPNFANFMGDMYSNPFVDGKFYMWTIDAKLYYTFDFGSTWQEAVVNAFQFDGGAGNLYYADGGETLYKANGLYYSRDMGKSWRSCRDSPWAADSDTQIAIDPLDSGHLYLASNGEGVLISTDGCDSWNSSVRGLKNHFVNTIALDRNNSNVLYAGTKNGAYVSFDGGLNWSEINDGLLGATVVYSIAVDKDSNVYAGTPYGIFKLEKK